MKAPTDLQILQVIYDDYYNVYSEFQRGEENSRRSKIHVPIDCQKIANKLKVDGDIVFGRLYYYLEQKHGYKREDDSKVSFFALGLGSDKHCINFPLLTSILADLQEQDRKARRTSRLATIAIVISAVSAGFTVSAALLKMMAG